MSVPFLASMAYGRARETRPHRFAYDYGSVDPGMFAPAPERNRPRRAPKRGIAYTIPLPDDDNDADAAADGTVAADQRVEATGHVLGVNALALAMPGGQGGGAPETGGLLFSGGRDGVVKVWDLDFPLRRRDDDSGWAIDRPRARQQQPRTRLRASQAVHSDWVNDVVVADAGQTVISASSDQTLRAWAPFREGGRPQTVGAHVDYVKALAYSEHRAMVVSGGLDRQIKLWDVGQARPSSGPICALQEFGDASPSSSVYTLACNMQGSMVVSGSPEKVVRVWDTRAGCQLTTLTGHTDHIRAVLLSADSELVLSGSSDTTVKLWSMRMRRCLSTFSQHRDSVWALYSTHPRLQTFYSASRDGLVAKTIGAGAGVDDAPGHRRPSLTPFGAAGDTHTGPEVLCVAVAQESQGVVRLVAADDTYIWTATKGTELNRWLDVSMRAQGQTQTEAQAAQPRRPAAGDAASPDEVTEASLLDALHQLQLEHRDPAPGAARSHRRNRTCDDVRNNFSRVQPRPLSAASTTTSVLSPVIMAMQAEMARRGAINEAENEDQDQDQDAPAPGVLSAPAATSGALAAGTLHALESPLPSASLIEALSATRSPMSHPQHLHGTRPFSSPGHRGRVLAPARSNSIVPVRAAPDESIRGRHGLRRHRLLPSKRHVLTQDTQGRVSLWDIMLCRRLHVFPESAEAAASSAQFPGVFGTDFDTVATAIAPDPEAISSWCHVDTRTGSLTVHLDEASVWSAEVHVDEVDGVSQETVNAMGDHERVNIGQWMLKRLFLGYTRARVKQGPLPPQDAALLNRWAAQIPAGEVVSVRPQGQPPLQTPYPLNGTPQPPQAAHDGGTEGKRPAPSIASSLVSTAAQLGLSRSPAASAAPAAPPSAANKSPRLPTTPDQSPQEGSDKPGSARDEGSSWPVSGGTAERSQTAESVATPKAPSLPPDGSPWHHQHSPSIDSTPNSAVPTLAPPSASQQSPGRTSEADIPSGGSAGKFLNRLRSMRMRKQRSTLSTSTSSRSPLMDAATLSPENEDGTGQQDRAPARPNVTRTTSAPGVVPNGASKTASAADGRASANQLAHDDFAEWAGPRFPTDTERSVALLQAMATPWDQLYSPVVCPRLPLPRNVTIQIFQECVDASGPYCIYRCVADTIGSRAPGDSFMSAFCITDDLLLSFELCMPAWLTDFLLFNRLPAAYQEPAKIAFVLGPSPASTLPPLPNPNARLVANRMLRARKLAIYVVEKLGLPLMDRPPASYVGAVETCMRAYASAPEQPAPPAASTDNAYASAFARAGETLSEAELAALDDVVRWQGAQRAAGEGAAANYQGRPELYVALLCKDKHVPPKHTLATIKASIWKSSSDVQIHYEWAGFIKKRVARAQHIRQQSPEQ